MAKAAILFAITALLATLANILVGAALGFHWIGVGSHTRVALPTTVLAMFAWTVVVYYFVGAFHWVKEEVAEGRAPVTAIEESRAIRRAALPAVIAALVALMAAYVLGGGADTGAVAPGVHLGLALLALLLHVVAVYRTIVFVGMALDLQARIEAEGTA